MRVGLGVCSCLQLVIRLDRLRGGFHRPQIRRQALGDEGEAGEFAFEPPSQAWQVFAVAIGIGHDGIG